MGNKKISVILLAAGQGRRMNSSKNKVLMTLFNKRIIDYSLEAFKQIKDVIEIIVVYNQKDYDELKSLIDTNRDISIRLVSGGKTRVESVYNGLKEVSKLSQLILLHDAARPIIKKRVLDELIIKISEDCAGVLPVLKQVQSLNVIEGDNAISSVDKSNLFYAQTPQLFKRQDLENVMWDRNLYTGVIVQLLNKNKIIKVIDGDNESIKITVPSDLEYAEYLLRKKSTIL